MKYILNIIIFTLLSLGFVYADAAVVTYIPVIKRGLGRTGSIQLGAQNISSDDMLIVPANARSGATSITGAHSLIRISLMKQLLRNEHIKFHDIPYSFYANFAITVRSGVVVASDIDVKDDLDRLITKTLRKTGSHARTLAFNKLDIEKFGPLYLWKNADELRALGYKVISSRYRTNYDAAYRRHNILTAFAYLGHVRVLNPGDSFYYLGSIHYDPKTKKNYKNGLAIVQDEEIPVYGGGICGGSTATYQGLVTNMGLKLEARNHSKWFSNLYTATINGERISTPGIDATVFAGSVDLKVTNTSDHPIIIVLNYNGNYGGIEETMSLGLAQDQGSLSFVGQKTSVQKKAKINPATGSGYTETVRTGCYTWNINGTNKTSCYREIH